MTERGGQFLLAARERSLIPEQLAPEQQQVAELAHEFLARRVLPRLAELEAHDLALTRSLLQEAGELGLLGTGLPAAYGGLELGEAAAARITEALAPGAGFALTAGAHTGIGTLPLALFGSEEQKQRYLPALASGTKVAAYALTEPGSGSDALAARTRAQRTADGRSYLLNGSKQWITNAGLADLFTVYAKVDGQHFTAFLVERDTPGLALGPEEQKLGIRGSSTRAVHFHNTPVPAANVLGEVGRGHVIAFSILNLGRFRLAAGCLGTAKRAWALAAAYAQQREQFGRPIAAFPLIQEKLARMAQKIFTLESMVYRTAGLIDGAAQEQDRRRASEEYAIECSINKVYGSEALSFVVDEALQIHGGYGYMEAFEVARLYRDARINRIFEGTNEINRLLITDQVARRAKAERLPLLQAVRQAREQVVSAVPPRYLLHDEVEPQPLARARWLLTVVRWLFLLVAGQAWLQSGTTLEEEQELARNAAELAIGLFAAESAILRAEQLGRASASCLAVLEAEEVADTAERLALESVARLSQGDALWTQVALVRKLLRRRPLDRIGLRRSAAAAGFSAGNRG